MIGKVIILLIWTKVVSGQLQKSVLLNGGDCGRATQVPGGVVVSQDPIDTIVPIINNITCLFTIQTFRPRQSARLVFDHITLEPNDCREANIEIYDDMFANDSSRLLSPTICPGTNPSTLEYISTGNWLTISITANIIPPATPQVNFSASYASFTAKPCQRPDLETECTTEDRCIYNELLCDSVDACGDNTDESEDPPANCEGSTTDSPSDQNAVNNACHHVDENTRTICPVMKNPLTEVRILKTQFPQVFAAVSKLRMAVFRIPCDGSAGSVNSALVAILVLAAACLIAYTIYILMSFSWFSQMAHSCLRACVQYALTKRKKNRPSDTDKVISEETVPS